MPVETKCSPIFTIGPFVDHHPHLHHHHHHHHHHPLLHHHHVPWTNRISSSINESDGDRDSSHSSEATNSDHCQLDSTSTTSTESNQSTPPMQYNNENREMSPPTSTTTTSTIVNEKPALPPRPSHLQANSSNHQTKTFNRSPNRTTPNTPSCPISSGSSPMTSEKEYTERIAKLQMDNLIPLKEDVSDWINRIMNLPDRYYLNVENFMDRLDNGVIVCKLAKLIEEQCNLVVPNQQSKLANQMTPLAKTGTKTLPENSVTPNGVHYYNATNFSPIGSLCSPSNTFSASTMKCWDNAKSSTFFARDNVSNFLNWCRLLGVKDAVLFETEDLVSHVNQRNVVLCLLEVARIACTRHQFSPAPGLVEFELEIEREIAQELKHEEELKMKLEFDSPNDDKTNEEQTDSRLSNMESVSLPEVDQIDSVHGSVDLTTIQSIDTEKIINKETNDEDEVTINRSLSSQSDNPIETKLNEEEEEEETSATESEDMLVHQRESSIDTNVTELTGENRQPSPTNSVISSASSTYLDPGISCGASSNDASSSHSTTPTPMTSELDHKVMQIAKTYYGKEARQGVQRLSEGKYKIANRIVFVRLLKARHVMVRVGGGWTTLSHFLVRHGGDPNHEILPDELLPLDTKMQSSNNGPRRRSSSTHTLVIPGGVLGGQYSSKTPTPTPDIGSRCSVMTPPTTSSTGVSAVNNHNNHFSRYCGSTPVSRRSSLSSPEPSFGSSTSGYSSSGTASNNTIRPIGSSSDTKIPVLRRRQRLPSLQLSHEPFRFNSNRSSNGAGLYGLPRSTSTILTGPGSELSQIPRSRYPNYLQSSQHITRRNNQQQLSNIPITSTSYSNISSSPSSPIMFTTPNTNQNNRPTFSTVRSTSTTTTTTKTRT